MSIFLPFGSVRIPEMGIGMICGVALGSVLGLAVFDNIGLGIGIGLAGGIAYDAFEKKDG